MNIDLPLSFGPVQSTLSEMLAVSFGLLSVWYMRKERIIAFPFGIINVLIYVYIFFVNKLYANATINAYFFFMTCYGWYNWTRKSHEGMRLKISASSFWSLIIYGILVIILTFFIRDVLIRYTSSTVPGWDAFTTAMYMIAQWLLSHKKIENWLFWIAADVIMVILCFTQGLYFTAFQYFVFTFIATMGFLEWRIRLIK